MSESQTPVSPNALPHHPDDILSGSGSATWQAYNAMVATKDRYFKLLEVIDNKKKNYNLDPTANEAHRLACLLKDHDEQVRQFTQTSQRLAQTDAEAHAALFDYIGWLNRTEPGASQAH